MLPNDPNLHRDLQALPSITAKEFTFLSDSLEHEDMLARFALRAATQTHEPEFKHMLEQIARERLMQFDHCLTTLQVQGGYVQHASGQPYGGI